jgi:hypothetical protein
LVADSTQTLCFEISQIECLALDQAFIKNSSEEGDGQVRDEGLLVSYIAIQSNLQTLVSLEQSKQLMLLQKSS